MSEGNAGGRPHGGPPWIQPAIQQEIAWRDGDIVISVPPKSGTTWTMNIVYQLLTGGTPDFQDIYEEVPWIEFVAYPGQPFQDVVNRVAAMPEDRPRAFKTHSAPPDVPFIESGSGKHVKYLVIARNPEEAIVSFKPFIEKHTDEWSDLWGMPRHALAKPDFPTFYADIIDGMGMNRRAFFGFLMNWWPLRGENNVLFLHYSDMKRDHEGSIRKIAKFLSIEPAAEQWPKILEYTSFDWMKRHEDKFEAATVSEIPILKSGAMIRQGQAGKAASDGMTGEISRQLRALGEEICDNPAAVDWYYSGGECP